MERYVFLKWGQNAFNNFRVVPPGTGICHQVNLEYLAQTVWTDTDQTGATVAYPDTLVGTDSHTTMVNGLAVLGWGVGGIEAEAAMLGQPVSMLIPEVVGFRLTGAMMEGTTATDLVLKVVQMLRKHGVVGKFVEFYGEGLDHLPLADRATIANMAPEYGATCGFFPIDDETLRYLRQTGRDEARIALVEAYAKANGMWRGADYAPVYTSTLELDMGDDRARHLRPEAPAGLHAARPCRRKASTRRVANAAASTTPRPPSDMADEGGTLTAPNDVLQVREGRGRRLYAPRRLGGDRLDHLLHQHLEPLCADRRRPRGAQGPRAWPDRASPGSRPRWPPDRRSCRNTSNAAGLQEDLDAHRLQPRRLWLHHLHRQLRPPAARDLEGDRRERPRRGLGPLGQPQLRGPHQPGRARQLPRLARRWSSPMRIAGDMNIDLTTEPARHRQGRPAGLPQGHLADEQGNRRHWSHAIVTREAFLTKYADVFKGDAKWQGVKVTDVRNLRLAADLDLYPEPALFPRHVAGKGHDPQHQRRARARASRRHDHHRPHLARQDRSRPPRPAGKYLTERQVPVKDFNSYGSRRGNHEVMMRGTFANIRIKNEMLDGVEGGYTLGPDGAADLDL